MNERSIGKENYYFIVLNPFDNAAVKQQFIVGILA